jgi:hypothetical protein
MHRADLVHRADLDYVDQVQVNNDTWISVQVLATSDALGIDPARIVNGQQMLPANYNRVTVNTVMGADLAGNITGIRWAWGETPCCPRTQRDSVPCPPNSCGIGTINSSLPAVPFMAKIIDGKCACYPPMKC